MKWWLKGIIGTILLVVVLCVAVTVMEHSISSSSLSTAQDDRLSELLGSVFGIALVLLWLLCFLTRGTAKPQEQEVVLDAEETVTLEARHCGHLRSNVVLIMGKGLITEKRFFWKPNKDLSAWLYRAKPVSILLSDVQEATQTSFGANKQVLLIKTSHETSFRFTVDDVSPWLELLKSER